MKIVVLFACGIWIIVVFLVMSLCRAAQGADEAMDAALGQAPTESPLSDQTLRTLDLRHAAALLGVSPETLLTWEARYGFPTSSASDRRYNQSEVLALRGSIADGVSIAGAVAHARQRSKRRPTSTHAGKADHRGGGLAS
jgi:hypothetical protein